MENCKTIILYYQPKCEPSNVNNNNNNNDGGDGMEIEVKQSKSCVPDVILNNPQVFIRETSTVSGTISEIKKIGERLDILIIDLRTIYKSLKKVLYLLETAKPLKKTFKVIVNATAATMQPTKRWEYFQRGLNMLTGEEAAVETVLKRICKISEDRWVLSKSKNILTYTCPYCNYSPLEEVELCYHVETYHCNDKNVNVQSCEVCYKKRKILTPNESALISKSGGSPWAVHLRNCHGRIAETPSESEFSQNSKVSIYAFALAVVKRNDGRYLLVQEFCNVGFWLPGGRVNPCEDIINAAKRETKEEAGVDIDIKGVLRFEYAPSMKYVRLRVIFYAEPIDSSQFPKSIPDYESVGASYVHPSELKSLYLRGSEPLKWIGYLENGGAIHPLSVLSSSEHN